MGCRPIKQLDEPFERPSNNDEAEKGNILLSVDGISDDLGIKQDTVYK